MYCINCGSENPDEGRFCRICGQHFDIEQRPTGPIAVPAHPASASISSAPLPSEQIWFGAPSEHSLGDAPTAIPNTPPIPQQYSTPSSNAMYPASAGLFSTPAMDSAPGSVFPNFPPPAGSPGAYVETPQGISTPSYGIPAAAAVVPPRSSRFHSLAHPVPRLVLLCMCVLVAGIFIILFFTGSDWAAGAMHLAIGAASIAVVIVLATAARSFAGMASRANPKRTRQFINTAIALLLFLLLSLGGFTQQGAIHTLQAHSFEGQQQWQSAINEYQLGGERAPVSDNIARVYNEWGEQLAGQQRYQEAFVKFDTILNAYGSPADQVNRAQINEINAYIGWAKQAMDAKSYSDATTRYNDILQKPYCQTSCKAQVNRLDATAYYDLAESELSAQNYTDAVTNFGLVLSLFPNSPEAATMHKDYAQALYGEGHAQLTSVCSSAIPTYRQLVAQFSDTTQGQQAAAALKAPQPVKGRFIGAIPHSSSLVDIAALMKGIYANIPTTTFYNILSTSPQVTINSDGTFTFKPLPQGTYDLAWGTNNTADGSRSYVIYSNRADNSLAYVAKVGPLCPFDFGSISQDIPAAP